MRPTSKLAPKARLLAGAAPASLLLAVFASSAYGQETETQQPEATRDVVTVTGFRSSLAQALQAKREENGPRKNGSTCPSCPNLKGIKEMIDFVQKQIEASERLFKMMAEDHKERMTDMQVWGQMNESFQKKLAERDAEIAKLKQKLAVYETNETL